MKKLKCLFETESSPISDEAMSLLKEKIESLKASDYLNKSGRHWSYYIGFIREDDNAIIINPKFNNIDFNTVFKYAIATKKYRSEEYMNALCALFSDVSFSKRRGRELDCDEVQLAQITNLITAFCRRIKQTRLSRESEEIKALMKKLGHCYQGRKLVLLPSFFFDTSKMFELYIYGILVHKYPTDMILYQKKNGNMIPDFIVPGDENSIGFIADAKYLPPRTEIREKDLKKMEKYAKSHYYKRLTESVRQPDCFFFCSGDRRFGYDAENIIENSLVDIAKQMKSCPKNSFYRVAVKIPVREN